MFHKVHKVTIVFLMLISYIIKYETKIWYLYNYKKKEKIKKRNQIFFKNKTKMLSNSNKFSFHNLGTDTRFGKTHLLSNTWKKTKNKL